MPEDELVCGEKVEGANSDGFIGVNKYSCVSGNYKAPEVAYTFTAECSGLLTAHLKKVTQGGSYLDLFFLDGSSGECSGEQCLGYDWMSGNVAQGEFEMEAGHPYYIVVDGWNGTQGGFELKLACECECIPDCDGKECGDDGCGGVCGICPVPFECTEGGQCFCEGDCCAVDEECDDDNDCTLDACVMGDCFHAFVPGEGCCLDDEDCNDDDPCTYDVCTAAGACQHSPAPPIPGGIEICGDGKDNDCNPDTVCYFVKQNGKVIDLAPVQGQSGVVTYYGYSAPGSGSSANTGYELSNSAVLFLYEDPQGNISLLFIMDKIEDGSPGKADLQWDGAQGMEVLVYDDHLGGNDIWNVDLLSGSGSVLWKWGNCCTDGFALGYLKGDFCIDFTLSNLGGIQNVIVWDTPTHNVPLDGTPSFSICSGE